jgi:hypothetical protein
MHPRTRDLGMAFVMIDTKIHSGVVCRSPALAVGGRTALNAFGS